MSSLRLPGLLRGGLIVLMLAIIGLPFIWMLLSSFQPNAVLIRPGELFRLDAVTLDNYARLPREANFLLVLFEGALSAEAAMGALAEAGYAVRHLPGQDLPHALRITIGTETQMDEVAAVLRREAEAAG